MPSVSKIWVKGFKSIAEMELSLGSLNVMIGANGAGKSNLISVFKFLDQIVNGRLQLYVAERGGADRLLHHGGKQTKAIELCFGFGQNAYQVKLTPAIGDALIFEYETIYYHNSSKFPEPMPIQIGQGNKESNLIDTAGTTGSGKRVAQYILDAISNWTVYHFHDTSDSAPSKKIGDIDDNRFFRPDAANLAPFLYRLKNTNLSVNTSAYQDIVETIRLVAPFFEDFILEPSRNNPEKIKLEWKQKGSDAYFDAFSLSDGTLRFICLATLLLQPQYLLPSLVLLDEPELGLHPYAITLLAEMLQAATTRTQVLVATQSVTLLNQFLPEQIIVAENDGVKTSFRKLPLEDLTGWKDDYSLGDLWEKNIIGGRP